MLNTQEKRVEATPAHDPDYHELACGHCGFATVDMMLGIVEMLGKHRGTG
jgi:hypothetical protein